MDNIFPYIVNNDKTLSKQLVSGYGIIDVANAQEEFPATKEIAALKKENNLVFDWKKKKPCLIEKVWKIKMLF